jgi:hypothetical protein
MTDQNKNPQLNGATPPEAEKENKAPVLALPPGMTTEPVPEIKISAQPHENILQLTKLYPDTVALLVAEQQQPILVKATGKVILGRYSPGDASLSVDLTPYSANLLGVSRQHAMIWRPNKSYMIQDIGSTNGTWLNEMRLVPHRPYELHSGDMVRLGQLALYVYFNTAAVEQPLSEPLYLKSKSANFKLTPGVLEKDMLPYLNALVGIQALCDEIRKHPVSEPVLSGILFEPRTGTIRVNLEGVNDAVDLVKHKINAARARFVARLAQQNITQVQTAKATDSQPNTATGGLSTVSSFESELAQEYVDEVGKEMASDERKPWVEKMLPYISVINASIFEVTAEPQTATEPIPNNP